MMGDSIASSTLPPSTSNNAAHQPIFDPKFEFLCLFLILNLFRDEIIARLRLDIDAERDVKEKLFEGCLYFVCIYR